MSGSRDRALREIWRGSDEAALFKPAGLSSERPAAESSSRGSGAAQASAAAQASPSAHISGSADSFIVRARSQLGWPDAQLPHRLDRPTSGILMVAGTRARVADHAEEQRRGLWTKWYVARLPARGHGGRPASGLLGPHRAYIRRRGRLAECVRSGGDPAFLEILAVEPATDRSDESHALIRLDTGRFHQIRAMLAHAGFPLAGDADYGARSDPSRFELVAAGLAIDRPAGRIALEVLDCCKGLSPRIEARLREALTEARPTDEPPDRR
ncbi:MAG: pseudouridine synthase [Planctomycetota bacterium]